jgi:hypothetical protein
MVESDLELARGELAMSDRDRRRSSIPADEP